MQCIHMVCAFRIEFAVNSWGRGPAVASKYGGHLYADLLILNAPHNHFSGQYFHQTSKVEKFWFFSSRGCRLWDYLPEANVFYAGRCY
jgi:hypothetical protein